MMVMMMMMDSQGFHILRIHDTGMLIVVIHNKEIQVVRIHHEGILIDNCASQQ